mgnify:CR=1 FL=1
MLICGRFVLKRAYGFIGYDREVSLSSSVMAGTAVITAYAGYFSVFCRVGMAANIILIAADIIFLFIDRADIPKISKVFKSFKPWHYALFLLIILISAFFSCEGLFLWDTGLYHAQAIHWIEDYGVIIGSGHIQNRLAYNSSFFCLCALYGMRDIFGQSLHDLAGFYAAFMVSKKVTVYSHKEGEDAAVWESDGVDGYTVKPCDYAPIGTKIVLSLMDNTEEESYDEFLETYRLSALVKKYSDYIRYPIRMQVERSRKKQDSDEYETVVEDETLNSQVPLWRKNKNEITKEEYAQFYRDAFHDYEDPISTMHINTEGMLSYTALLFVPKNQPFGFNTKDYKRGLKLYANGVMIMEHCEELLPEYFNFVQGLVDSPDLSLNISREMLQHDRQLSAIANNLKKKILSELLRMQREEREAYEAFFKAFGRTLKFGVYDKFGMNKDFLKDTLLFYSRKEDKPITLKEYVDAMPEAQKHIYYASGDTLAQVKKLPQAERVADKGYDILCLTEDVDEFALRILETYQEKPFRSVSDPDLDLNTDEEKAEMEKRAEEAKPLLERIKTALGDKVLAAKEVLLYGHDSDISHLGKAIAPLESSLDHFRRLSDITDSTYYYANSMHTSQRRIPVSGATGKN